MGGPDHFSEIFGFIWAMRPVFLGGVRRKWKNIITKHTVEDLQLIARWLAEGVICVDETSLKELTDNV